LRLQKLKEILICGLLLLAPQVQAEDIHVGGTGSASPLMQKLGAAYHARYPADEVRVMLPPPSSGGGLRMLLAGKLDVALAGRKLSAEEASGIGAVFEYVRTPLLIAGRGTRKAGFTRVDLAELYAGRLLRWDDGAAIRLIMRSPYESDTLQLRGLSPAVDVALRDALARPGMAYAENDLDAVDLLSKTPGSVGTSTLGLLKLMNSKLTIYPLDGVMPSVAALSEGRYPLSKSIFVVVGRKTQQPSAATKRFIEFLHSPEAMDVLRQADYQSVF
jgi:phosphate transport system substrate-binding protein